MMIDDDLARIRKLFDETKDLSQRDAEETHRLVSRIAQLTFAVWLYEGPTNPVPQYDLIDLARAPRTSRLAIESIVVGLMGVKCSYFESSLAGLTPQERHQYELVRAKEEKRFEGVKPYGRD